MQTTSTFEQFDCQIACHAEVDMLAWLTKLTGQKDWHSLGEDALEISDVYSFARENAEAQVVLYHSGHVFIEAEGECLYDGHLGGAPDFAVLHYFNLESGEPISLN